MNQMFVHHERSKRFWCKVITITNADTTLQVLSTRQRGKSDIRDKTISETKQYYIQSSFLYSRPRLKDPISS